MRTRLGGDCRVGVGEKGFSYYLDVWVMVGTQ